MAWETPKTDWHSSYDSSGVYDGDRFNARDFNRIKNNLAYLHELAQRLYDEFSIESLGEDRTPRDYFYADEINQMEANFVSINSHTISGEYGDAPTYIENGNTMDFIELNRLEEAILDLYDKLTNQFDGRRMFTWNFGTKGGL